MTIDQIEDICKNIKWELISLDGLLDFILNESKLLMQSVNMQRLIIQEFNKRFLKDHISNSNNFNINNNSNISPLLNHGVPFNEISDLTLDYDEHNENNYLNSKSIKTNGNNNNTFNNINNSSQLTNNNSNNSNNITGNGNEAKKQMSFTSELVLKLISKINYNYNNIL